MARSLEGLLLAALVVQAVAVSDSRPAEPLAPAAEPARQRSLHGESFARAMRSNLQAEERAVARQMDAEQKERKQRAARTGRMKMEANAARLAKLAASKPTAASSSSPEAGDSSGSSLSPGSGGPSASPTSSTMLRRATPEASARQEVSIGWSLAQAPACKAALEKTQDACDSMQCMNASWHASWSKTGRMAYLETGKAASESMEAYMSALFNDTVSLDSAVPWDTFAWTFVRDPLERAFSAYAETDAVTRRLDGAAEHEHAVKADVRYVDVPASIDGGAARFIAYLDDVIANRVPYAWRPQHSRPVADFLRNMPGRVKFVGKLENLERDWPAMQGLANLLPFQRTDLPPWIPMGDKPAYEQAKAVPRSDEVLRKVCEVYAADYACFDYELPAACKKQEGAGREREVASAFALAHPNQKLCDLPKLAAGSHVILVNHDVPDVGGLVNGMFRRMLRMADAMSSLGLVVHVVLHEWYGKVPTTMPQQRLYKGSMWEQFDQARDAAGGQLQLGVVFTTAITMRVSRNLREEGLRRLRAKGLKPKKDDLGASPEWNDEMLSDILHSEKFAEKWPEESVISWLSDINIPTVAVTDDIHYLRAPAILEASGQCDPNSGCGGTFAKWMQIRELDLYASSQMVFTVSTEDQVHIEEQFVLRKEQAKDGCTPPVQWLPYVEEVTTSALVRPFKDRTKGMFYVGTAHVAGQRAVEWLVSEVQVKMREMGRFCQKDDVGHLYVAGQGWSAASRASRDIQDAVNQGRLTFLGVLSDAELEEKMKTFKVFAAPVFNTTGVATKNIFAIARGLPLVTTKAGTQGLGLTCHLCADAVDVEDTAGGFAQQVIRFQENENVWNSKSIRGLEHAELMFTFAAEKSTLRSTFKMENVNAMAPTAVDSFAKPNDRMIELAQDGLHRAKTPACIALADDFNKNGEKSLFTDHGIGLQACALETAFERPDTSPPDVGDEQLFACPLTNRKAEDVSEEMRQLHRNMLQAGYVRFDNPTGRRTDPEPINVPGGGGHETRRWPRPGMCEHRSAEVMDLYSRMNRQTLTKLVNWKRGFEYRPMLKAGSTMMRHVLPCLQPGEWKEVQQKKTVPPETTLLVLQRDPISRFASGLVELMERIFRQQCPEGPCNFERDKFEVKEATGAVKKATLWYSMAKKLFDSGDAHDFQPDSLRRLVRSAALDASCNLRYYGAEHFASQTGLQLQGDLRPDTKAMFFDLDELGESIDELLRSDFVRTVLGGKPPPSKEDLEICLGSEQTASVQVMLTNLDNERAGRRQGRRPKAADAKRRASLSNVDMDNMTNHHSDLVLPSTAQIVAAIQSDPATHLLLRAMYAQDFACNEVQRDLRVHTLR